MNHKHQWRIQGGLWGLQFNHQWQCFERSAKICEPLDIEAKKPRICGRQIIRDNVEAESPEDYFRKSITVPFLYCTLNEMKTRFTDLHARTALGLQLVPSIIENVAPPAPRQQSLWIRPWGDTEFSTTIF